MPRQAWTVKPWPVRTSKADGGPYSYAATLYKGKTVFFTFWGDSLRECLCDARYFRDELNRLTRGGMS